MSCARTKKAEKTRRYRRPVDALRSKIIENEEARSKITETAEILLQFLVFKPYYGIFLFCRRDADIKTLLACFNDHQ
jgi:hypothetical protein